VAGSLRYYAAAPSDGGLFTDAGKQHSVIRHVQVSFTGQVFLDPKQSFGLSLVRLNGPAGAPAGTAIQAAVDSTVYDPATGATTVVYRFTGPGTEFGSLEDGNYSLTFNAGVQLGGPGGPALSSDGSVSFYRLFGDGNGDRHGGRHRQRRDQGGAEDAQHRADGVAVPRLLRLRQQPERGHHRLQRLLPQPLRPDARPLTRPPAGSSVGDAASVAASQATLAASPTDTRRRRPLEREAGRG